ncbi:hypothetical protein E0J20_09445 [Rhizobium leguminosarum bv. viciae]|nr:hypothetical protein E0J20_09445 [Rhizobium leguminosarum bv. viciae]
MITGFTYKGKNIIVADTGKWNGLNRIINVIDRTDGAWNHIGTTEVETINGVHVLDWCFDAAWKLVQEKEAEAA